MRIFWATNPSCLPIFSSRCAALDQGSGGLACHRLWVLAPPSGASARATREGLRPEGRHGEQRSREHGGREAAEVSPRHQLGHTFSLSGTRVGPAERAARGGALSHPRPRNGVRRGRCADSQRERRRSTNCDSHVCAMHEHEPARGEIVTSGHSGWFRWVIPRRRKAEQSWSTWEDRMSRASTRTPAATLAALAVLACLLPAAPAQAADDGTCVGKGEYKPDHARHDHREARQGAARPAAVRRDRRQGQAALPLVRRLRGLAARPRRLRALPPARRGSAHGQQEGARRLRVAWTDRPRLRGWSGSRRRWA